MSCNTLVVVGTGIKFMSHLTTEAKVCIEKADKVLYLINEPFMQEWIKSINPSSESLDALYTKYIDRDDNYKLISEFVLKNLESTKLLCLAIYGHPTYLAQPVIYSVNSALKKGFNVFILPGISSIDCLFADLGIDPGTGGYQSFEATDFLIYNRAYNSSCHLVLWQISVIGLKKIAKNYNPKKGLDILTSHLNLKYPLSHPVFLYEASQYPSLKANIKKIQLRDLSKSNISRITTLYIPPKQEKKINQKILKIFRSLNINDN